MKFARKLFSLEMKLSFAEAALFYVVALLGYLVIGGVLAMVLIAARMQDQASTLANVLSFMVTTGVAWAVYKLKNKSRNMIVALVLAAVLSFFGGGLLGLVPVAWMRTKS